MWGGGQLHAQAALPQVKTYSAHCTEGWVDPEWTVAENLAPPLGLDPWTVQPIVSHCIAYAIPAHYITADCTLILTTVCYTNFI